MFWTHGGSTRQPTALQFNTPITSPSFQTSVASRGSPGHRTIEGSNPAAAGTRIRLAETSQPTLPRLPKAAALQKHN